MTDENRDAYFTPGMKEWFFYREGMLPIEFEAERLYTQDCFEDYVRGEISPLWKQMQSGEITAGMKKARFYREGMSFAEYQTEYLYLGEQVDAVLSGAYKPLWQQTI